MRTYELVLILRPVLTDAQKKKLLESVRGWLKDLKIVKENDLGVKPLSYKIKKELSGHFIHLIMEAKEGILTDLERKILNQEDIIRHLLLRTK